MVKGVSSPKALARAMAIAVLPVPGWPASSIALPAIFPSLIMLRMIPAALRGFFWPTRPWATWRGSKDSSIPRPLMWEWALIRSILVTSFISSTFGV
jgi:hypothetical protein